MKGAVWAWVLTKARKIYMIVLRKERVLEAAIQSLKMRGANDVISGMAQTNKTEETVKQS